MNSGVLLGFLAANFLEYKMQAVALSILPIIFFTLFSFVPESPAFLLKVNKMELARESMKYYGKLEEYPEADKFLHEKVDEAVEKEAESPLSIRDFCRYFVLLCVR